MTHLYCIELSTQYFHLRGSRYKGRKRRSEREVVVVFEEEIYFPFIKNARIEKTLKRGICVRNK